MLGEEPDLDLVATHDIRRQQIVRPVVTVGRGCSAYVRYIVTALVLVAAVTIDSLTRRSRTAQ